MLAHPLLRAALLVTLPLTTLSAPGGARLAGAAQSTPLHQTRDRSPLWGRLDPGPHAVGFRQLLLRDPSRPKLPEEDGAPTRGPSGRQMQIAVWYPARSAPGRPMRYGEYIDRLAQELDFTPIGGPQRRRGAEKFMAMAGGLGGDTTALRAALLRLASLPTSARVGATPARGRFPLVLFPEWRAPASNSILAEYLASHGYIVASPTLKGTYDAAPETSVRGLETHVADLRFVIAALDSLAFVDRERIGAIGVGIAASAALALQMRTPALRALVSLEGGITTALEMGLVAATPYYDVAAVRAPILAITAPHPAVDPARLDIFRYATRHLVRFPRMGEFWFLNFGVLDRYAPRIIGATPGDVASGFEWGARWTRVFLDAYLAADDSSRALLASGGRPAGAPDSLFTVVVRPGIPAPPNVAELKQLVLGGGGAALAALADQRRLLDSQPIPSDYLGAVSAWLGNTGRDARGDTRYEIAVLRAQLYPRSARARFSLGMSASTRGDSALARSQLAESLRLMPDDTDPALDAATRSRIERQARDALARLGAR